jgi:hypothetical protein
MESSSHPENVGDCLDQILSDAEAMAPYYKDRGALDDGTRDYLRKKVLKSYPSMDATPLPPLAECDLRRKMAFYFAPTSYPTTLSSHKLRGLKTNLQDLVDEDDAAKREFALVLQTDERVRALFGRNNPVKSPPYVEIAKQLIPLLKQRSRHEAALEAGLNYYSGEWIVNNLVERHLPHPKIEINLWRSSISGVNRRTGETITDGRLVDGGDSVQIPCFVNDSHGRYKVPIVTFFSQYILPRHSKVLQDQFSYNFVPPCHDMRSWLFKFDPLPQGKY